MGWRCGACVVLVAYDLTIVILVREIPDCVLCVCVCVCLKGKVFFNGKVATGFGGDVGGRSFGDGDETG